MADIKADPDAGSSIYFIPKAVPCPHCGVRYLVDDLARCFAAVKSGFVAAVVCEACNQPITFEEFGRYFGRIDGVSAP